MKTEAEHIEAEKLWREKGGIRAVVEEGYSVELVVVKIDYKRKKKRTVLSTSKLVQFSRDFYAEKYAKDVKRLLQSLEGLSR